MQKDVGTKFLLFELQNISKSAPIFYPKVLRFSVGLNIPTDFSP